MFMVKSNHTLAFTTMLRPSDIAPKAFYVDGQCERKVISQLIKLGLKLV